MNNCQLCSKSTDLFCYVHQYPLCYNCTNTIDHQTVFNFYLLILYIISVIYAHLLIIQMI